MNMSYLTDAFRVYQIERILNNQKMKKKKKHHYMTLLLNIQFIYNNFNPI